MQKTTTIALITALTLVAAAFIGVTFAQTSTPNPTANPSQTVAQWCINPDGTAPYCYNIDSTYPTGCCYGPGTTGYCAGPQGYSGYEAQAFNQFDYGNQAGYGYQGGRMGNCGRGW
jgi:hypothetical protein